ncbi:MAG: hypothetical protein IJF17_13535 [Thermoguttaceae bacterium]|nr:hypothetical protein [Thermoguttaceae bacterium]
MKSTSKRSFSIESLENRVMLSAIPLTEITPAGSEVYFWQDIQEFQSGETRQIKLDTRNIDSMTFFCASGQGQGTVGVSSGYSGLISNGFQANLSNLENQDTVTIEVHNTSMNTDTFVFYAVSGGVFENEFIASTVNNTPENAQQLTFRDGKTAVLGQLENGGTDYYRFISTDTILNAQLYSLDGHSMKFQVLDKNKNILGSSTSADGLSEVLSSVKLSSNEEYYLAVFSSSSVQETGKLNYSLILSNESFNVDNAEAGSIWNTLSVTGAGKGKLEGQDGSFQENRFNLGSQTIRSIASDDSTMAVVASTDSLVSLYLLEYTGSVWQYVTSKTWQSGNADGIDLQNFGTSLSISGTTILAGDGENDFAAVFSLENGELVQQTLSSDGYASFGTQVILSGNFAFVSAPLSTVSGQEEAGIICAFQKNTVSGVWERVTFNLPSEAVSGAKLGTRMAWNEVRNELCFSAPEDNLLFFYRKTDNGFQFSRILQPSGDEARDLTELGHSIAFYGDTFAVGCSENGVPKVRIYVRNGNDWILEQTIGTEEDGDESRFILDWGEALSLNEGQLVIGSKKALNDNMENVGIVRIYSRSWNGEKAWILTHSIQHEDDLSLGHTVSLNQNRLDVLDPLKKTFYSITDFADVDRWELNVTDASQEVSLLLEAEGLSEETSLEFLVTAPDGSNVLLTRTANEAGQLFSFTPNQTGEYRIAVYSLDSEDLNYSLSVVSGIYGNSEAVGELYLTDWESGTIIVEYAQQILISSLETASASLGGKALEVQGVLDGNKVVWSVPGSYSSKEYELVVDGLETVSGDQVSEFRTTLFYSGGETVQMKKVCADGTDILRGTLTLTVNSAEEQYVVEIPARKGMKLDYAVSSVTNGLVWEVSDPVFDETGGVYVLNVSASMPGTLVIEAVLGAELMDGATNTLTFLPLSDDSELKEANLAGTLESGETKELNVTVGAGETVNFVLTDNVGNLLNFSLWKENSQIAEGMVGEISENGQKILNLKNNSGSSEEYVLKIENETDRIVNFEFSALKEAVWESGSNDFAMENVLQDLPIVGGISSTNGFEANAVSLSLSAEQHGTFGQKTVVSGNNAVVSGANYVVVFVLEGGTWIQKSVYETDESIFDLALDGNTLAIGHNGSVEIFELSGGSLSKVQTLEVPESIAHQENSLFGITLALDGDTLAVGARAGNLEGSKIPNQGYVFIYSCEADGWKCVQQITSPSSIGTDEEITTKKTIVTDFGLDIALEDGMMVILGLVSDSNLSQSETRIFVWHKNGAVWHESLNQTVSQGILSNSNLQIQNGTLFFTDNSGNVFASEGSLEQEKLTFTPIVETGLSILSFSVNPSGDMIFLSAQDSVGNYYWAECQLIQGNWVQTGVSQGTLPLYSSACGENGVLASCPQIYEDGTAYAFQWESNFDCDTYWVSFDEIPTENSVQIQNADGSAFSGNIQFMNSRGETVQLSEMSAGEIYQIQVFPAIVMAKSEQRYVLSVSGTSNVSPSATLVLPMDGNIVREAISSLTLKFSENVDLSSLTAGQVFVSNGTKTLTASSFNVINGAEAEFVFSEELTDGTWTLSLAETLKSLSGESFELKKAAFTVDTVPAAVTSVEIERETKQIIVTFSESVSSAVFELFGELSGIQEIGNIEKSEDGTVWTLTFDDFEPDRYVFSISLLIDRNGNVTETVEKESFSVETNSLSVENSDWQRAVLDGSFAQKAVLQGFVSAGKTIEVDLSSDFPISVKYPEDYSGEFTAVWEDDCLTIRAGDEVTEGAVFSFEILKNSFVESSENETILELTELVSAALNEGKAIRQTSVSGKICSGQTDRYSFSANGGSSLSAALIENSQSSAVLTMKLYEKSGNTLLAESTGSLDTLEAWISSTVTPSSAGEFVLEVFCSGGSSDISTEYSLVITENALFNGVTHGTLENAIFLEGATSAVGHASGEFSALLPSTVPGALAGSSITAEGRFLFVGTPGDSEKGEKTGKVTVYEFDGIEYRVVAELFSGDIANASFGASVVLDGKTLAVAAPDCLNTDGTQGAIYFYEWNEDGSFTQTKKITNPFLGYLGFGYVMDYSDGMLVVGSNYYSEAGVFIFKLGETEYAWNFLQLEDLGQTGESAFFGYSVAVNEEWIAIGTPQLQKISITQDGSIQTRQTNGAVFYLKRTDSSSALWSQVKIEMSQESDILLGYSIAEDGGDWAVTAFDGSSQLVIYAPSLQVDGESNRTILEGVEQASTSSASMELKNGLLTLSTVKDGQNTLYVLSKNANDAWEMSQRKVIFGLDDSIQFSANVPASANGTYFLGIPDLSISKINSGAVYVLDTQSDFYRMVVRNSQIQVTFRTNDGNEEYLNAVLTDSSGNQIAGTEEHGTFTFSGLEEDSEYFLEVSLKDGIQEGCDYVMSVTGISFSEDPLILLEKTLETAEGTVGLEETLAEAPKSLTLTFDEALSEDRISIESVKVFNGKEEILAERFEFSQDGRSVTFHFSGVSYESLEPYFILDTKDFRSIKNGLLEFDEVGENGIAELSFRLRAQAVSVRLNAGEETGQEFTEVSWNLGGNAFPPSGMDWGELVTLTRIRGNSSLDLLNDPAGEFTFENGILTWRASCAEYCVKTGDVLKTVLNVDGLVTDSGVPFANTQFVDGKKSIVKDFNVNLLLSAQSKIVLRKSSSIVAGTVSEEVVPENESWLHEWNTVWAEVWANVVSTNEENGLRTYSAQIAFDPELFTPLENGELTFLWDEANFESVQVSFVENSENILQIDAVVKTEVKIGRVDENAGTGASALIASICLKPASDANSGVKLALKNEEVASMSSGFELVADSIWVTDRNEVSVYAEDLTGSLPNVYPVPYDLNDDGSVGINDLVLFARNYGKITSESEMAVFCDFDASGSVGINDLVLFARNYGKSRVDVSLSPILTAKWENVVPAALSAMELESSSMIDVLSANASMAEKEIDVLPEMEFSAQETSVDAVCGMNGNVAWTDWSALASVGLKESEERNEAAMTAFMEEEDVNENVSSSLSDRVANETKEEELILTTEWNSELLDIEWNGILEDVLKKEPKFE